MIKTKVINLDRRSDRWENFKKSAEQIGLSEFERFSAIDGKKIEMTAEIQRQFKNNKFGWRAGIMGACLSHYSLWKELSESNYEYYLILEDDITFCKDFVNKFDKLMKRLKDNIVPLTLLGYTTDKDFIKRMYGHDKDDVLTYKLKHKSHVWGGIFAYVIHKKFASQLVSDIDINGFLYPADTFVLKYDDLYVSTPILVTAEFMSSTNNIDSDIQYDLLSIHEGYEFYCLKDSPGSDIVQHAGKPISELIKLANADKNCKGFNTLGFLKHKIRDPSQFIKLPGTDYKLHGLYVKK